jgi:tetratricopeptide (TPR) repeat protein
MAAAHATLGALKLKRGDVAGAEQEIRAALAERPDLRLAHFNLALAAEQRGDRSRAIAEYREEIAKHPNSYMAQFNLGKLYEAAGDSEAQRHAWDDAIASNPQFAEGFLFLSKLYLDRRDFTRAEELARKGLDLSPASEWAPLGHFVLADAYAGTGRADAAAREAREARRLETKRGR